MTRQNGHWTPILRGKDAERVFPLIESIGGALGEGVDETTRGGDLSGGSPGPALFFAYLSKAFRTTRWFPQARTLLEAAFKTSFEEEFALTFMEGRPGVLWTAHHLEPAIETTDIRRLTHDVDDQLLTRFATPVTPERYDLFRGLIGHVRFGLDRSNDDRGRYVAEKAIARLIDRAEPMNGGVTWWTEVNKNRTPEAKRHIRLGLAYGVPSAIATLAEAHELGLAPEGTRAILDGAVRWLLAQQNADDQISRFGTIIVTEPDGLDRRGTRVAWCWGDLGVSIALHAAALNLGECWWADEALELARHAARRSMEDAGVVVAGVCHGAAGAGHLFNRLYQNTREEIFLTASRRWFDRALEFSGIREKIAMHTPWGEVTACPWPTEPGLLSGLSGIGLALLAAVSDIEPKWDKALLISLPPRPQVGSNDWPER